MAPAVTRLEIRFGSDSRLLQFAIGDQMSTGGIDVAKCELLPFQVTERVNRRVSASKEDRAIMQVLARWTSGMTPYLA